MNEESIKRKLYEVQQKLLTNETTHFQCICGSLLVSMIMPTNENLRAVIVKDVPPPSWVAFQCGNPICKQAYVVIPDDGKLHIVTGG